MVFYVAKWLMGSVDGTEEFGVVFEGLVDTDESPVLASVSLEECSRCSRWSV
jgi:hypothetical protein